MEQSLPRRLMDTELVLPPSGANRTASSIDSEMNFDTNMVVILAALLCALIGALGVNSIIRCVVRCGHRFRTESPEQTAARLATTGLKKRDLNKIPVAVYGAEVEIKGTECAICLGEFEDGDKVRVLTTCNHGFHVRCIDVWLVSHSSCPKCRHSLLERPIVSKGSCSEEAVVATPRAAAAPTLTPQHTVIVVSEGGT